MGGAAAHPSPLDDTVRRVVASSLGSEVARIEWLEGQLGLRRFARVHLETGPPATLIVDITGLTRRPVGAAMIGDRPVGEQAPHS